ncbi:MAG: response regulator, partial [Candidatus Heimdallarchaeota archaeon]|nr:response regulator [Candidatus Heimdallarchaeota archaeon]MCK4255103.1 response regulator [Candidatus Heimdallarchaeota archaeon]
HRIVGQSFDGEEALIDLYFNFEGRKPDILIVDYHMPVKNGLELLEDLNDLNWITKIKILFISSAHQSEINAYEKGIAKYITKPFKFSSLGYFIKEIMDTNLTCLEQCA